MEEWGESRYVDLTLTGSVTLAAALSHLYVLLPVLDGAKHYWVGADEVDKLIRTAGGWLGGDPERELITRRYLAHQRSYVTDAVDRLAALVLEGLPLPVAVRRGQLAARWCCTLRGTSRGLITATQLHELSRSFDS